MIFRECIICAKLQKRFETMAAGTSFLPPTVCLLLYFSSCVCKSVSSDQYSDNDELPTFRFASHFSDHMVLQRKGISKDLPPVIWGFGEVAQTVKLTLGSVTKSSAVVLGKSTVRCSCLL